MKISKNCVSYAVAPLSVEDRNNLVTKLREKFPPVCGIATFEVCRAIGELWMDERNSCSQRQDRYKPCTTLCYVCVDVLNRLHRWDKKYLRISGRLVREKERLWLLDEDI